MQGAALMTKRIAKVEWKGLGKEGWISQLIRAWIWQFVRYNYNSAVLKKISQWSTNKIFKYTWTPTITPFQ